MKKCGITEWYLPLSGPSAIKLCRQLGIDGMQMTDMGGPNRNYPLLDERIKMQYFEELDGSDFTLYSLHPLTLAREPGIQFDIKSDIGQKALEVYKKSIQTCREYNIPTILLASFAGSKFKNRYELKKTIETLREYKKIADDNGVRITYESFCDLKTMLYIREQVGGINYCYDILNPLLFGFSDPKDDLEVLTGDMIDHVHVKDSPETMVGFCPLGDGDADVKYSLSKLNDIGFEGWYVLENHYNELPMAQYGHGLDAIVEDIKRLKAMW